MTCKDCIHHKIGKIKDADDCYLGIANAKFEEVVGEDK